MSRYMIPTASYLILLKDNQVLLARRENTGFMDGMFSLPAGHSEHGETFSETIIRETEEEIGINLDSDSLTQVLTLQRLNLEKNNSEYVDIFFTCQKWDGEITNKEPEKCGSLEWHPLDNLPENIIPYVAEVLESFQKGVTYIEQK